MSDNKFNVTWKSALNNLPRNIYNFTVRYLNNTLANATNCFIWKTKSSPFCHYCSNRQTLGHVVGGCQTFLEEKRYTWRHNSVLQNIASSIPRDNLTELFVDLVGFQSPSIITGDQKRPDLIIRKNDILWILELSVGFETNIEKNRLNKENRYKDIILELKRQYNKVNFINLSMGAIGIFCKSEYSMFNLYSDLNISKNTTHYHLRRLSNVCIRCTYFIFCSRDKSWCDPAVLCW